MSNSIFLDTNGWLALLNATEQLHDQAFELWLNLMNRRRRVFLTDWIIAETGNGLAKTRTKSRFVKVVREMLEAPSVELVVIERDLLLRSLTDYASFTDKAWGLVDCSSFLVMKDRGIVDSFTSDRHFEQAGFNCLLKP
jgi:uncharacterized protein